jgi:Bacteriocin-protection, YdeI or OmpD-Associated/Domain of unknown function (DUF1905)
MKNLKLKLGDGFVELPFDVKKEFGKARPPVRISINGYSYRSTVCVYGGNYFVPVCKANQEAAGVNEGETVSVTIAVDNEVREVEPPPELSAALAKNRKAKSRWEELSYTNKKEHAAAMLQAKKPETRARRLEKIIEQLTTKR